MGFISSCQRRYGFQIRVNHTSKWFLRSSYDSSVPQAEEHMAFSAIQLSTPGLSNNVTSMVPRTWQKLSCKKIARVIAVVFSLNCRTRATLKVNIRIILWTEMCSNISHKMLSMNNMDWTWEESSLSLSLPTESQNIRHWKGPPESSKSDLPAKTGS